jgi:hypothetical protein
VQVPNDEGIANHIGPKPCAEIREGVGEASAGERAGQPLSRDRKLVPDADAVCVAEGKTSKYGSASAGTIWRGRRTWHACTLLYGNREISSLTSRRTGLARIGKAKSHSR